MKRTQGALRLLFAFLVAAVLTGIAATSWLSVPNNSLADALYQRAQALSGDIIIIGIDERALEALGPWPWSREVMAKALHALNADPAARPAVIGIDAIFSGDSSPEADKALLDAVAVQENVVLATAAVFGSQSEDLADGSFYVNDYAVTAYDEPSSVLRTVSAQGHINAMLDEDGILRHAIWQIDLPDGRSIPSFHQQVYRLYAERHAQDADFTPPTDARHRFYVPLQAKPGGFDDGFSVLDLLTGELDSAHYADKIVLIGPYAAGLQDSYYSAIDRASPMFGVEFQANTIASLLAGEAKDELSRSLQLAVLFLVLFLSLLWLRGRRVLPATLLWLALSLGYLGLCMGLYALGFVLIPLYIPLFASVCYVGSIAANYISERMEKRLVTSTFRRYVAPEIVTELLRGDPESLSLGGKLCDIAVLFVDIRGFTSMSEQLPPTAVVDVLNRYLNLTSDCIFRSGGTLDKYIGDCTMALWGAPLPQEDCAFKAVRAALDMVEGARALSDELYKAHGHRVDFGIGVHCGPAIVGNIGSKTRMDYTAIGDTVNTAARLESNAPAGQIYVSRAIADALGARLKAKSLGDSVRLKGKAEGFEVLQVEALQTKG